MKNDDLKPFTTDGCSGGMSKLWRWLFGVEPSWEGSCVMHDFRYWVGGSRQQRHEADLQLMSNVALSGHPYWAIFMYIMVRAGGVPWLPLPWRWGYGHKTMVGYTQRAGVSPELPEEILKKKIDSMVIVDLLTSAMVLWGLYIQHPARYPNINQLERVVGPEKVREAFTNPSVLLAALSWRLEQVKDGKVRESNWGCLEIFLKNYIYVVDSVLVAKLDTADVAA